MFDNEAVGGGPSLTMTIDETSYFTQDDIDKNITACNISGNNEVAKGTNARIQNLFGKVVWVSTSKADSETNRPLNCAVQARGVARFNYDPSKPLPKYGQGVVHCGVGLVAGGLMADDFDEVIPKGQVIAIDTVEHTCDVWLG
jgi:hypothetical protein